MKPYGMNPGLQAGTERTEMALVTRNVNVQGGDFSDGDNRPQQPSI
jgi:hypothetical protein